MSDFSVTRRDLGRVWDLEKMESLAFFRHVISATVAVDGQIAIQGLFWASWRQPWVG